MLTDHPWLLLIAGLVLLTAGGECLVRGAARLARRMGVAPLVIGLTVVAFGTSSPELFVCIQASLADRGDIAAGNVIGSNIANIGLILAVCAIVYPMRVSVRVLRVDMPVVVAISLLAIVLLGDDRLSRLESVLLVFGLFVYTALTIRFARREQTLAVREDFRVALPPAAGKPWVDPALVLGGLVALVLGAQLLVTGASTIARASGVSEGVIGLTIVAVGTSLPELSASLVAALRRQPDIAIGNIVGSCIFNILGNLGFAGLAAPLRIHDLSAIDLGVMLSFALLLLPFMKTGFKLQRWEGAILLAGYIAYLAHLARGVSG